jgi:hypothetical protein
LIDSVQFVHSAYTSKSKSKLHIKGQTWQEQSITAVEQLISNGQHCSNDIARRSFSVSSWPPNRRSVFSLVKAPSAAQHSREVAVGCQPRRRPARPRSRRRLSAPTAAQHARQAPPALCPRPACTPGRRRAVCPRRSPAPREVTAAQHAREVATKLSSPAAAQHHVSSPPRCLAAAAPAATQHVQYFQNPDSVLFVRASCNMSTPPTRFYSLILYNVISYHAHTLLMPRKQSFN